MNFANDSTAHCSVGNKKKNNTVGNDDSILINFFISASVLFRIRLHVVTSVTKNLWARG